MRRADPIVLAIALALAVGLGPGPARATSRLFQLPSTVLWAWEQPQDLRFIDPSRAAVAFLATTIRIGPDGVRPIGRRQPLQFPPGTCLVAVARIEALPVATSRISPAWRSEVAGRIVALREIGGVRAVQIDFDASLSQRAFYRELLGDIRRALPDSVGLSMTALASWCVGDRWLEGLPVDEVVPMLFRMGADDLPVRNLLSVSGEFDCARCRSALGLSTDESVWRPVSPRRIYLFTPGRWSHATLRRIQAKLEGATAHDR